MMRFFRLGPLILVLLLVQSFADSYTSTTVPADSTSPQELNTSPSNSSYDEADGSDPSPSLTPPHQHTTGAESNTTMISRLSGKTSAFPSNGSSTAITNLSSASGVSSNFTNDDPNNGTNEQVVSTRSHATSPPLTRSIMVSKPAVHCTFTVLKSVESNVATEVNIISSSNQTYWLEVKGNDGTLVTSGNVSYAKPFKILFDQIKPCKEFEVHITGCSSNQSDFSFNESVSQGHSVSFLSDSQVSFKDKKWNLEQNMTITRNNSCQNKTLTFPEETCTYTMNVHIPPVKPLLTYSNSSVPVFHWRNRENQCAENLFKVICTSDGKEITSKLNESVYLVPSKMYNCSGIYNYSDTISESNYSAVYINCSWINSTTVNSSEISITWSLTPSETCSEIAHNKASGFCESLNKQEEKKISCDKRKCDFTGLIPFTYYTCTIDITNDNNFHLHQIVETIQTNSSNPEFKEFKFHVLETSHNSFNVSCHNLMKESGKWNGPVGTYLAELMINNKKVDNKTNATCYFSFKDLHYHTTYQIRITVINGDGKKTFLEQTTSTSYNDKAVVGFLVFLILVTSVALIFVLYKIFHIKNKRSTEDEEMLPRPTLLSVEPICADSLIEAYKSKIADDARLFLAEFQSIPRIFSNYTIKEAKRAENQSKNRYVDILPYDYNRVALSSGASDYINCSFIEGFREPKKFIAAQGPKEETIDDFWRMIWEQKSSIIVMVTRCEEGNKPKCAEYWPSVSRETEIYEDFVVKIQAEEHCPDYIIRRLVLTNKREKATEREVNHIQFISWPDHGVPGNPSLLLKLRKRVNSFNNFFSGPIVVHCSAGVGRTGTYISIDAMIESLEAEGKVDIYGFVAKLRRQRCLMVQVEAQYILIHTALIEHNQFGDTEVSLSEYHSTLNSLRQKEGDTSFLEIEFEKLPILKNWRTTKTGSSDENKEKNRYTALVPYDYNRVLFRLDIECSQTSEDKDEYSSDEEEEESNEYINASFIDGYWCEKSLIAAQGPLPQTTAEFLLMLYQQQTKTLVMLTDLTENNQEYCCQYWGDEKKVFGEMEVEVKKTESFVTYVKRRLALQSTKKKSVLEVDQYQFLKWRSSELPENAQDLMEMLKAVKANGGYDNSKTNRSVPVVVHCNNGSSRTAIFCALWNLMDSASNEKLVDVFQVAKSLRKERPGMLETFEQYQFLYTALEGAFPVLNGAVKASASNNNLNDISEVVDETASLLPEPSVTNTADDEKKAEETLEPEQKKDAGDAAENCSFTPPPAEGDEVKVSVDATTNHVTVEL